MSPIVPRASISGRALVAVVAIMTFLASITTGAVLLVSASAAEWQSEVASEITIQVRPARRARSRRATRRRWPRRCGRSPASSRSGLSARTNRPNCWSRGSAADLSIDDLPVPRVIVARVQPGTVLDLASAARAGDAGGAVRQRRRSPRLDRADALDDRRHRVRRHRHPRAGDHRDHHLGVVRDPRRDGGEPPDRRGAAFRRRRRQLHRQPLPAAFPPARPAKAA